MANKNQIKLIQIAARRAGLRTAHDDGRYRLLLGQYKQSNGQPVTSCKQLNNWQIDDFLAICEAYGWRYPGKSGYPERSDYYYRSRVMRSASIASFAQQSAIIHLGKDLGWNDHQREGMIKRMTSGTATSVARLSPREAHNIIEAMKNMLGRMTGKDYGNLKQVQQDMEVQTNDTGEKKEKDDASQGG